MRRIDLVDVSVAVQVVVNMHSGQAYGYEILLRGWEHYGLADAEAMIAACAAAGQIDDLELMVRRKAMEIAPSLPDIQHRMLLFNLDARADWGLPGLVPGGIAAQIVSEITAAPPGGGGAAEVLPLRQDGRAIAVDRFGRSSDDIYLLQACAPDFIKFDRSLISGIDHDTRKRVVLSQFIGMAHILGAQTVAVGIENSREYRVCRELGCDLAQGFFIQAPVEDPAAVATRFPQVEALFLAERRRENDRQWILEHLDTPPAVRHDMPLAEVFGRFARNPNTTFIPVVDAVGRPLGILCERNLKNYAYSTYGKDLIANKQLGLSLMNFLERCPITDIGTPLDQMLAIYAGADGADGILVAKEMVYHGFLSAGSLVRATHERHLSRARDENPLSKLPGNAVIEEYVRRCLASGEGAVLVYLDFDNFKPFNDTYGFRQGDRAILLFAEMCRRLASTQAWFLGHIGGDDFFVGLQGKTLEEAEQAIGALIAQFASDAESFYDAETRAAGYITAQDREGNVKNFPLLSASAVLYLVPPNAAGLTPDEVSSAIAAKKKAAKSSPSKMAIVAPTA